jgi:hypothetical protein
MLLFASAEAETCLLAVACSMLCLFSCSTFCLHSERRSRATWSVLYALASSLCFPILLHCTDPVFYEE